MSEFLPQSQNRIFAIVPAAGLSRRMGQPKLLLPLGDSTVIGRLLSVLQRGQIAETVVVLRLDNEPLRAAIEAGNAFPLQPSQPPEDMRQSVQYGLDWIHARYAPHPTDGWLLIPADHPLLDLAVLRQLIEHWRESACRILVPFHAGRRGHPTIFRWDFAAEVPEIPAGQGLNWLLKNHAAEICELPVSSPTVLMDLDTPEDYAAALAIFASSAPL